MRVIADRLTKNVSLEPQALDPKVVNATERQSAGKIEGGVRVGMAETLRTGAGGPVDRFSGK